MDNVKEEMKAKKDKSITRYVSGMGQKTDGNVK